MLKYAVGALICLACIGISIWGLLFTAGSPWSTTEPQQMVEVHGNFEAQPEVAQGVTPNTVPVVGNQTLVTDNISSPAGAGAVRATFTVVG